MGPSGKEQRKHRRAFFTLTDSINLKVGTVRKPVELISATLLSISQGGLGFAAKRHELKSIQLGDILITSALQLPAPLGQLYPTEAMVRYMVDQDSYARVAVGCEFLEIQQDQREQIQLMVNQKASILDK